MPSQRAYLLPFLALACLAIPPVAAAQPEAPANRGDATTLRRCIDETFTSSWTPYDDHTILVRSGRQAFKVTTNRCPRLADPLPVITKKMLGGSQICGPHDVQLFVAHSADRIATPCFIQSIAPITEGEARAIEHRRR